MPSHWTDEDKARLRPRCQQVLSVMQDGSWTTLDRVAVMTGMRNASTVASRLRDFAGSIENRDTDKLWLYERRRTDVIGLFEYRLVERPLEDVLVQAELPFAEAV